jgi:arsenate reductase-like glutaredoxin family protein
MRTAALRIRRLQEGSATRELLERWCTAFGWETYSTAAARRGVAAPSVQARVKDEKSAIAVMLEKPSAIKRPVLENPGPKLIGFDEKAYTRL